MYKAILAAAVIVLGTCMASCETYTMESYYPSPVGVYTNMTVTSTTVLARDGGAVTVGSPAKPAALEVNGVSDLKNVVVPGRFASDPVGADQQVEGSIYFNTTSKKHRVFQDAAWRDLGGGSWPAGSYCIMANGACPSGFSASALSLLVGKNDHDHCEGTPRYAGTSSCTQAWTSGVSRQTLKFCCK